MTRRRADTTLAVDIGRTRLRYRTGRLVVLGEGDSPVREVTVQLEPIRIGSALENHLVLDDPHVSRLHCELVQTPEGFVLRDLDSTNGTLVEGMAVKEATLRSGVVLSLGTARLRFLADDEVEIPASAEGAFGEVVGTTDRMRQIFGMLERIGPTDLTISIVGETGTGKDVVARSIHQASQRSQGPFVVFDCGAVAPNLIESELFGHEKGAFTGAASAHEGAFERAHGGTLFLDEIGELALDLQPKLLRALEQRHVRRVGGSEEIPIDVRIIAATNRDLEADVREGKFREDLYFRLSVATLVIPPLRERLTDLVPLGRALLDQLGRPELRIAPETLRIFEGYGWPGNVRELRNVLESAAALCKDEALEPKHLLFFRPRTTQNTGKETFTLAGKTLESIERAAIAETLARCEGNKTRAAKALGIAPSTLYEKIKKYAL